MCTLNGESRQVKWYNPSSLQYSVLIVGQAPGKTEIITGVPFTGGPGKTMYSCMKLVGLNKGQLAQCNLVQCQPPADKRGLDRAPTAFEQECCFSQLYNIIQELQPELILALGSASIKALTGHDGAAQSLRGQCYPLVTKYNHTCPVICMLSPTFYMKARSWIPIAAKDFNMVHEYFIDKKDIYTNDEYHFNIDPTYEELKNYLYTQTEEPITFDTETTSLNPREAILLGFGFSTSYTSAHGVYFYPGDHRWDLIKTWLQDSNIPKAAQNGNYDLAVIENQMKILVQGLVYDTRLAEQILNSDMPKDLDHLRAMYTKISPYKPSKKEMKTIASWGKERMLKYVCFDAMTTYQVMTEQKKLFLPGQAELLEKHLVPIIPALNHMSQVGMKLDVKTLAIMYRDRVIEGERLEKEIIAELGINPSSPKQIMFKYDLESSDRETLEEQINFNHPQAAALQKILDYRDCAKGAGTFLKGVYDRSENGRIHTQYNIEGTGTGRLSSENPNLQNVPKPYRVIYIPDDDDHILISGDYSQLEVWVVSILAGRGTLYEMLRAGLDVHEEMKKEILLYVPSRLKEQARLVAKTIVFGTIYGRGERNIAQTFGVSTTQAREWQDIIFTKAPELRDYQRNSMNQFKTFGYVETPFKRRRYVQSYPQALNAPVQGTASDVTLTSLRRGFDMNLDLRLQVHDEIVIQAPADRLEEYSLKLRSSMESPIRELQNECFPTEQKWGSDWYNMTKIPYTR